MRPYAVLKNGVEIPLLSTSYGEPLIPNKGDLLVLRDYTYLVETIIWHYDKEQVLVYVREAS